MPARENISFERLADWAEGRLSEEEAEAVAKDLASGEAGEQTRRDAEWLRSFVEASKDTVLASPPPEVREELMRRFEAYAEERRGPGLFERLVASLTFDSGMGPAFGVRSAGARERQMIFTAGAMDIAINLQPRPGGNLDVLGQILPGDDEEPEGFTVQLLRAEGTEAGIAAADELGEFGFEDVAPGTYQILLSYGRVEILILPVELRL